MVSKVQLPEFARTNQAKRSQSSQTESFMDVFNKAREIQKPDKPREKEPVKRTENEKNDDWMKNNDLKKNDDLQKNEVNYLNEDPDMSKASEVVPVDVQNSEPVKNEVVSKSEVSTNTENAKPETAVGVQGKNWMVNVPVLPKAETPSDQAEQVVQTIQTGQMVKEQQIQTEQQENLLRQTQPVLEKAQIQQEPQMTEQVGFSAAKEQKIRMAENTNPAAHQAEIEVVDSVSVKTAAVEQGQNKASQQDSNNSRNMGTSQAPTENKQSVKQEAKATLEDLQQRVDSGAFMDTGRIISKNLYGNTGIQKLMDNQLNSSSLLNQVKTGIEKGLKDELQQFTIKLKPDGMGEILVRMVSTGGKVAMSIGVSNIETQKLLNSEMLNLKEMLQPFNAEVREVYHNNSGGMDMMNYQQSFYEQQQGQMSGKSHHGGRSRFGESAETVAESDGIAEPVENYIQAGGLNAYI